MTAEGWNTPKLEAALAAKYALPEWALLWQVSNGTGGSGGARYMDALAMSLWPSRGLEFHGFEVKAYRGDWLRELKNPAKADLLHTYLNRWWIVAGPDVVKVEELPKGWGLLTPAKNGDLRVAVQAWERADPKEPTRAFLAAILRRVGETYVPKAKVDELAAAQAESRAARWKDQADRLQKHLDAERKTRADFEAASGVAIGSWHGPNIGQAVRTVLDAAGDRQELLRTMKHLRDRSDNLTTQVDRLLALWEADGPPKLGEGWGDY